jgi:hypothetical protein
MNVLLAILAIAVLACIWHAVDWLIWERRERGKR